jgi:hypothetical protein
LFTLMSVLAGAQRLGDVLKPSRTRAAPGVRASPNLIADAKRLSRVGRSNILRGSF